MRFKGCFLFEAWDRVSDVPEKKDDLVSGKYELPAPKGKTKVAVKIIEMLGEEVIESNEV